MTPRRWASARAARAALLAGARSIHQPGLQKTCWRTGLRKEEQAWLSQVHASCVLGGWGVVPSRNKLSRNPPSSSVLFAVEVRVLWKYLQFLRDAMGHYGRHTSSAYCEEFLHQQLLTSKCKKGGKRGKSGHTKEKGEECPEQQQEWRLCRLG